MHLATQFLNSCPALTLRAGGGGKGVTSSPGKKEKNYKLRNLHDTPTFKTEALCLVSNVQLFKRLLLWNERLTLHYLALIRQLLRLAPLLRPRLPVISIASVIEKQ